MHGSRRGRPGSLPQTLRVLTTPSSSITSLAAHTMHGNMDTLNCYWQPKEQARLLQRGKRAGSPFFIHSELSPATVRRLGDRASCHMCALCKSVQALLKYSPQIHRSRPDSTQPSANEMRGNVEVDKRPGGLTQPTDAHRTM